MNPEGIVLNHNGVIIPVHLLHDPPCSENGATHFTNCGQPSSFSLPISTSVTHALLKGDESPCRGPGYETTPVNDAKDTNDAHDDDVNVMDDDQINGEHLLSLFMQEATLVSSTTQDDSDQATSMEESPPTAPEDDAKAARKARKKELKAQRRAVREGRADVGQKPCDLCGKDVNLLIRCRIDSTLAWHMVCGKCWQDVSGGVVDGDAQHPYYQYGGLWKNRKRK